MASHESTTARIPASRGPARAEPRFNTAFAWACWVTIILGAWLFVSAFLWAHSASSATSTEIAGLLIAAIGIIAMYLPKVRWLNTALAVWLFVSTLAIMHAPTGTTWNNAVVAILVFISSSFPSGSASRHGPATRAATAGPR